MAQFVSVMEDLNLGKRIHFAEWEASTVMFVENNELFCQRTKCSTPYPYSLSWMEITSEGWSVV